MSGIVIDLEGYLKVDLSAKAYLADKLDFSSCIFRFAEPLKFNTGCVKESNALKNSGKSYTPNSVSNSSSTLASAIMFFIVETVDSFLPGLNSILAFISLKFLNILIVLSLIFISSPYHNLIIV